MPMAPAPASPQSLVCTAAYVLGEYGRLIRTEVPPAEQYRLLHNAFPAASQPAKALLMTALLKVRGRGQECMVPKRCWVRGHAGRRASWWCSTFHGAQRLLCSPGALGQVFHMPLPLLLTACCSAPLDLPAGPRQRHAVAGRARPVRALQALHGRGAAAAGGGVPGGCGAGWGAREHAG